MRHRLIYLDNNTTAKPSEKAVSAMMPYLTDMWGHHQAPHQKGQQLHQVLETTYRSLYRLLDIGEKDTLIFTSSGVEAINQVMHSVYRQVTISTGKNQFITSILDEAPSILSIASLESLGCISKMIPALPQGYTCAEALANILSPRTALVSLSCANGLTGVIQPIQEIAALCHQRGILLHLDVTHILGKVNFSVKDSGADFVTFNGTQLHAPKGTGILCIKHGIKSAPLLSGGSEQGGLRAGEINTPLFVSLATAIQETLEAQDYLCTEVARLRDRFEEGVCEGCPSAIVLFKDQNRLPHCSTIAFPGIINEALLFLLNRKGVCACIGGNQMQQLGLILEATGVDEAIASASISFSLSRYNSEEEIEHAIHLVVEAALQLSKMSEKISP